MESNEESWRVMESNVTCSFGVEWVFAAGL